MSMNEGLAHPWAAAIFARAQESKRIDEWANSLLVLQEAVASPAWQRIKADARLDRTHQARTLIEACGDLLDIEGQNLVRLLAANRRLDLLGEIRLQYQSLCDKAAGVVEVQLISALAADGDERAILAALRQRFGAKLRLVHSHDPHLIGGVVVRQGDRVLDASLKGSLERMARHLRA